MIEKSRRRLHIGEETLPLSYKHLKIIASSEFIYSRTATGPEAQRLCPVIPTLYSLRQALYISHWISPILFYLCSNSNIAH